MKKIIFSIIVVLTLAGCHSEVREDRHNVPNSNSEPVTRSSNSGKAATLLQAGGTIRICYDTNSTQFRGDTNLVVELSSLKKIHQLLSDSAFKPAFDSIDALCVKVEDVYAKKTDIIVWPFYLLSLISIALLALFVLELTKRKKLQSSLSKISQFSQNNLEMSEIKGNLSHLSNRFESLSTELALLKERYNSFTLSATHVVKNKPEQETVNKAGKTDKINVLYAVSIYRDTMKSVTASPDVESIFKMSLKNESEAAVTIYEKSIDKVLSNSSFLDGCDYTNLGGSNPRNLTVEKEGVAIKRADNSWLLSVKPKIVLR